MAVAKSGHSRITVWPLAARLRADSISSEPPQVCIDARLGGTTAAGIHAPALATHLQVVFDALATSTLVAAGAVHALDPNVVVAGHAAVVDPLQHLNAVPGPLSHLRGRHTGRQPPGDARMA